jgi:hypothetical protein
MSIERGKELEEIHYVMFAASSVDANHTHANGVGSLHHNFG